MVSNERLKIFGAMVETSRVVVKHPDLSGPLNPQALYEDRIKMREWDIDRRKETKSEYTEAQEKKMYTHEKNMMEWNVIDQQRIAKLNKNIAILVGTHSGHTPWLKACLEACKKTGYFIVLAFDNPFWQSKNYNRVMPSPPTMALADSIVFKHRSYLRSVGVAHFWNMIYGLSVVKSWGFEYTFSINGDCVMDKPEDFPQMIELLGDGDIFPNQYEVERRYIGTMGWLGKTNMMLDMFHQYRKELHMYSRTTEGRLWHFVQNNGVKVVPPEENHKDNYRLSGSGTWYKILGFRHIHAEHKVTRRDKLPPPEEKYYDLEPAEIYKGEWHILKNYWKTGEEKYLKQWWGVS